MKNIKKIVYLIFLISFMTLPFFSYGSTSISEHFTVPNDISDNTKLNRDIDVFFEYSDALYTLPDSDQPTDIFRESGVWDPLEFINRIIFTFNLNSARYIIRPLSMTYSFVVPEYVRKGIRRMDGNIQTPGRIVNSLLQLKFVRTGIEVARFGVNSTVGILGFYDPAYTWLGMEPLIMNFGQTFAYWGIGEGFYVVLPIQGSTSLRDAVGLVGDYFTNPITYIPPYTFWNWISWGIKLFLGFNNMTLDLDNYLRICKTSLDPYETVKTAWVILEKLKSTRDAVSK